MAAGVSETNGMNGVKAASLAQKKRKADAEGKSEDTTKEEVEGTPKSKKQKIITVTKKKEPATHALAEGNTEAAPTTALAKRGKSKSETTPGPTPVAEEEREDATPNVSRDKAAKVSRKVAKEAKTQDTEALVEEKAVEKEEEAKQMGKPLAKTGGKKGKAAKADKPEEEKKKEEPKRRSKRVITGGKA